MKQFSSALFACLTLIAPNAHAYNASSISFSTDNDGIVGTDKNYTNGVFIEYNSAAIPQFDDQAPMLLNHIASSLPLADNTHKGWSFRIGQQMWTPEDIEATEPVANERPYAGLLFLETSIYQYSPLAVDKYSAMLGTTGPNSLAEKSQKLIHYLIGSEDPMGWDYQIENQVVFNLGYQGHRLITRQQTSFINDYDISGVGRINVGNYQSELAVGGVMRWGSNLANSFGTSGFSPGKYVDISVLSSSKSGYFLFSGIESRYRFNDITIDGDRPNSVPDLNVKHLQATAVIGATYYQPKWGASLSFAFTTPEYKEDKHRSNSVGSLELFWRL